MANAEDRRDEELDSPETEISNNAAEEQEEYEEDLLKPPLWLMAVDFLIDWSRSRSSLALFIGLPSFIAAVSMLVLFVVGQTARSYTRGFVDSYLAAADDAIDQGRLAAADLWYRKLAVYQNSLPKIQYFRGREAERIGQRDLARELMQSLVPPKGRGFPEAHFWLARDLVSPGSPLDREQTQRLQRHLRQTLADIPTHTGANDLLARVYLAGGDLRNAARYMAVAAEQEPRSLLPLARIYTLQGNAAQAQLAAQKSRDHYRESALADPASVEARITRVEARILWADAEAFLNNHVQAEVALLEGVEETGDPRYRAALARLYASWFDALAATSADAGESRLDLLDRGLEFNSSESLLLTRLATLTAGEGDEAQAARDRLNRLLAQSRAPATVYLILGQNAIASGDLGHALYHLEHAFERAPRAPVVLNNLAWVLATKDPPQLQRALDLADAAVKLLPSHADIRDTRGQILHKLGRDKEALPDLELALRELAGDKALHGALAEVYESLGHGDLAAEHRRRLAGDD
ncbi:MAG: hypothetical protein ACC628_12360 [Pirellulaceae bacterium]